MNFINKKFIAQNRLNELKKKVENFENDSKKLAKDLENLAQQKDDLIESLAGLDLQSRPLSWGFKIPHSIIGIIDPD